VTNMPVLQDYDKELIANGIISLVNSAPIVALSATLAAIVQWNLEHLSIAKERHPVFMTVEEQKEVPYESYERVYDPTSHSEQLITVTKTKVVTEKRRVLSHYTESYHLKRLSTKDTSDLQDPNKTPIAPPILSAAARVADMGLDTAEQTAAIAQSQMQTFQTSGIVGSLRSMFFGNTGGLGGNLQRELFRALVKAGGGS